MSVSDEELLQELHEIVDESRGLSPLLMQERDPAVVQLGRMTIVMAVLLNRLTIRVLELTEKLADIVTVNIDTTDGERKS